MPQISVLMKPSSGMCNMSCDYCFYSDEAHKRTQASYGFMSEQTLKNIIRKTMAHAEGIISYAYQGGEPTLRGVDFFRKAMEYQKQYNKKGIQVHNALQTNGYALDGEWCRFFHEHHFLVGVSVDGTRAVHDAYRHDKMGNPTYDRILQAAELLDKYQVDYNILTVVNRRVAENIREVYEAYRRHGWRYQQYIACLDPLGEVRGQNSYALKPEQYGRFLIELFDLWYEDWKRGRQPYIRQFENYVGILLGYRPESCEQCGSCGIQYAAEADGSVYPCDFYMLDPYRLGNFNEHRLDDIDRKRRELEFVERSIVLLSEKCRACPYYRLCRGGCQRNRDWNERLGAYENYFCSSYQMFFDACLGRMHEVAGTIK